MNKNEKGDATIDFHPMYDYCLCDPIPKGKTDGGLIIPEKATTDDVARMRVVKVGPGHTHEHTGQFIPNPIRVGDIVFCLGQRPPFTVVLKSHLYLCVSARDVVGINRDTNNITQ